MHAGDDRVALRGTRDLNRLKLLEALFRRPGMSRLELAEATLLSRPTVSTLVDELERAEVVEPHDEPDTADPPAPRGAGRPPTLLSLSRGAAYAIGLDVGHAHVRAAVCDLSGGLLADDWAAAEVDHAPGETMGLLQAMVRETLERSGIDRDRVIGVGMALAVPVDHRTGEVFAEGIMPRWVGIRPAEELQERLGFPVLVENDANLGALGEHTFGVGRGVDDLAYVRLSAGIGLGLILGGRPYRGATGIAGELGHVQAVADGLICRCGNRGCLETVATPEAVARLLGGRPGDALDVRRLLDLVEDGDRGARRAIAEAGEAVGEAIAMLVNVLNPRLVVVGGELAAAGADLLDPLRAALERHAVAPSVAAVTVVAGALGERAEVLGAAGLMLERAPGWLAHRCASEAAPVAPQRTA